VAKHATQPAAPAAWRLAYGVETIRQSYAACEAFCDGLSWGLLRHPAAHERHWALLAAVLRAIDDDGVVPATQLEHLAAQCRLSPDQAYEGLVDLAAWGFLQTCDHYTPRPPMFLDGPAAPAPGQAGGASTPPAAAAVHAAGDPSASPPPAVRVPAGWRVYGIAGAFRGGRAYDFLDQRFNHLLDRSHAPTQHLHLFTALLTRIDESGAVPATELAAIAADRQLSPADVLVGFQELAAMGFIRLLRRYIPRPRIVWPVETTQPAAGIEASCVASEPGRSVTD
jgi:hypothetical protein